MAQRGVKKLEHRSAGPYYIHAQNPNAQFNRARKFVITRRCSFRDHRNDSLRPSFRNIRLVEGFESAMQTMRALFTLEREFTAERDGHCKPSDVILSELDECEGLYRAFPNRSRWQGRINDKIREQEGVTGVTNIPQ